MYDDNEDLQSFFNEIGDVKPIRNDKAELHDAKSSVLQKQKRSVRESLLEEKLNPLSMEGVKPLHPDDYLSYQQPGIQDGVFKNLRLGKYAIEQRISLTNMTLEEARDILFKRILKLHEKGIRAIVINHGKGLNSRPFPALKKSYVKHWLCELEQVIAFHTAQPQHGGLGATYVLLKKHPHQKQLNREQNRGK